MVRVASTALTAHNSWRSLSVSFNNNANCLRSLNNTVHGGQRLCCSHDGARIRLAKHWAAFDSDSVQPLHSKPFTTVHAPIFLPTAILQA